MASDLVGVILALQLRGDIAMRFTFVGIKKNTKGAAMVEMAIILVLLTTLVFGIIEFGYMLKQYQAVGSLANEAARTAALGGNSTNVADRVTAAAATYGLTAADATAHPWYRDRPNDASDSVGWTALPSTALSPLTDASKYREVKVQIVYKYRPITGFFSYLSGSDGTFSLSSTVVKRRET